MLVAIGLATLACRTPAVTPPQPRLDAAADESTCAPVSGRAWSALPGVEYTGLLEVALPPFAGGSLNLVVVDDLPLAIDAVTRNGDAVLLAIERLSARPGLRVPAEIWLDTDSGADPQNVVRVRVDAPSTASRRIIVRLGRRAPRVLARLFGYGPDAEARVCAGQLPATPAFGARHVMALDPSSEAHFSMGWRHDDPSALRMADHGVVLVPSARDGDVTVRLTAAPPGGHLERLLTLRVNDVFSTAPTLVRDGMTDYTWQVPASAWVVGTNEILFSVTSQRGAPPTTHGLIVRQITLELTVTTESARPRPADRDAPVARDLRLARPPCRRRARGAARRRARCWSWPLRGTPRP
jgi:hypothetical protein